MRIQNKDDVELSVDGKTIEICWVDYDGRNYVEIPVKFIARLIRPVCPHCRNQLSPAGGRLDDFEMYWACWDCNYKLDIHYE